MAALNHAERRRMFGLAAAMLATAGFATMVRPSRRVSEERAGQPLETLFPMVAADWRVDARGGSLVRPAVERGRMYGIYDQVLERVYGHRDGRQVMLSVAYGSEQSAGLQVHRPEICYPGGGFNVSDLHHATLRIAGVDIPTTRLNAVMPHRPEPITYWTVLGDVVERDATSFRIRQLNFGLRGQIVDGMLVRVSSIDKDPERGYRDHAEFAEALVRSMTPSARIRVIGKSSA